MHRDKVAALLILAGFSPSKFQSSETSSATGLLGWMYLGPHSPFSQVAQLDSSSKALSKLQRETLGRNVHQAKVQRCIDIALGIFRFDCIGRSRVVILAIDEIDLEYDCALGQCFETTSSQRLLNVLRNLTHLTGGEAHVLLAFLTCSCRSSGKSFNRALSCVITISRPSSVNRAPSNIPTNKAVLTFWSKVSAIVRLIFLQ
jgi:hypothetical protein